MMDDLPKEEAIKFLSKNLHGPLDMEQLDYAATKLGDENFVASLQIVIRRQTF
jgi:hypothetical protein